MKPWSFRNLAKYALRFIKYSNNITVLAFASGKIYHMSQIFYSEPRQPEEKNSMAEWWGAVKQKSHGEPIEKKKRKALVLYTLFIM